MEIITTADTQTPWITNNLNWQFDGMYRLTNETSSSTLASGCYTNVFVYDKVGNRRTKTHIAGTSTNITQYQYNSNDQLTNEVCTINGTFSTNSYGYDLNGSLVSKTENGGTIVYTYSLANKLNSVAANGATNSFLYNDNGIRVRSNSSSGTTTRYLIDGNNHTGYAQVLEETAPGGALSRSYVIGDDVLGQCIGTNAIGWLLYDGHGSTRQLVTPDAGISQQYNYSAYGETTGQSFTPQNLPETLLLYCGEQFDVGLQMYNLRARFYDPSNGRFNAMDSFQGDNFDPQSLHKYSYCPNLDPVNGVDPSGQASLLVNVLIVVAIIVVLAILAWQILKSPIGTRLKVANSLLSRSRRADYLDILYLDQGFAMINDSAFNKARDAIHDGSTEVYIVTQGDITHGAHISWLKGKIFIPAFGMKLGPDWAAFYAFGEYQHDIIGGSLTESEAQAQLESVVFTLKPPYNTWTNFFRHGVP